MTIQGHPVFALYKGPPGTKLLYKEAYDKFSRSPSAKPLWNLAHKYYFISKGSKLSRGSTNDLIEKFSSIMQFHYQGYKARWECVEKISKSEVFKAAWQRWIDQAQSIETDANIKKSVAIKYVHGMFGPIYDDIKRRFKFTDDECLQAFKDAVDLLEVKTVMEA